MARRPQLPLGFGFHPKDYELVLYFIPKKESGEPFPENCFIEEAAVYDHHPDAITSSFESCNNKPQWFFFTPKGTNYGSWVPNHRKKRVFDRDGNTVGTKQSFVYHDKLSSGEIRVTDWLMYEFSNFVPGRNPGRNHVNDVNVSGKVSWVVCKIFLTPEAAAAYRAKSRNLPFPIVVRQSSDEDSNWSDSESDESVTSEVVNNIDA